MIAAWDSWDRSEFFECLALCLCRLVFFQSGQSLQIVGTSETGVRCRNRRRGLVNCSRVWLVDLLQSIYIALSAPHGGHLLWLRRLCCEHLESKKERGIDIGVQERSWLLCDLLLGSLFGGFLLGQLFGNFLLGSLFGGFLLGRLFGNFLLGAPFSVF